MSRKRIAWSAWLVFLVAAIDTSAQDWPQWRGPNRDGVVNGFAPPASWPDRLTRRWKVTVGTGHSSPVVSGGKVYQFSRQDGREVLSCLDLFSGEVIWEESYPAPYRVNPAAASHGKGPKSTPVVAEGTVFTLGISGILSAFDASTGRLRWRKDFASRFPETSPTYGAAMSALVDGGALIAYVGGPSGGALEAFAVDSGQTRWSWDGEGPAYASPIVVELNGRRQLVTQSQRHIVAVSADDGKLLWKIPFTTAYGQNIVTAVAHGETLIFSGLDQGIFAIRVNFSDGTWTTEKVWENRDLSLYMSSPVLLGDWVFGLSNKRRGQFFCLDARTGATQWTTEGREGDNAALLLAGEMLIVLTTDGDLIFAPASQAGFSPLRRYSVADSPTWAHPAVIGHRILIKDESTLALWALE